MRGCRAITIVLVLLCSASVASVTSASEGSAKDRFESGRRLARAERWEEAAAEFRASLTLEPSIGGHLNLGNCYDKLGKPAAAIDQFRRAEELAGQGDPERAAEARARREAIAPRVPTIVVHAPSSKAATVDGRRAPLESAIEVEPGAHEIVVRTPPDGERTYRVTVRAGEHAEVRATEPSDALALAAPPLSESESASPWRTVGIVSTGVGLASLTAATFFYALAVSDKNDLEGACASYPRCRADEAEQARSLDDSARSRATIATVGFVAGAALVAAGAILVFGSPRASARTTALAPGGAVIRW